MEAGLSVLFVRALKFEELFQRANEISGGGLRSFARRNSERCHQMGSSSGYAIQGPH